MRRLSFVLLLFLSLNVVFASSTIGEGENGQFVIKGYYNAASSSECTFRLWFGTSSNDGDRIYQSGFASVNSLVEDYPTTIFNWRLDWTTNTSYTLTFRFTPLQSYVEKTYFIPQHSFAMVCNGKTQTVSYDTKASGNYKYTETYMSNYMKNISYTTNKSADPKELTGHCDLTVYDYEKDLAYDFEYISYITVEFKAK